MSFNQNSLYNIKTSIHGTRRPLFDLASWKNGLAFKKIDFAETGVPVIKIAELNNGIGSKTSYTKGDYGEEVRLHKDDLLFSWSGNPNTSIDVYKFQLNDGWLNQHIFKLTANEKLVSKDFLYYLLKFLKPKFTQIAANKQTTGLGHVTIADLKQMSVVVPDKEIQNEIVSVLKALDDKIEVNNEINRILFEQIDILYKSWFVDYKPFGGTRPTSWEKTDIYSISNIIYGVPFASRLFNTEGHGIPIIRIRDIKNQTFVTYTTEKHPKGYLLQSGDIVVGMDGEFRPYVWCNDQAWLNQRVSVFQNKRPKGKAFLFSSLKPLLNLVEQTEVATTVIHIGKKDYDAFEIVLPSVDVLDSFDSLTDPLIWRIISNSKENKKLTILRDTLLPKLFIGEIDLSRFDA